MKVLFVHPDLGVGGAERLIVDAALAAKSGGHDVTILTNQYDPAHCFEETKQLDILVKLNTWPRNIFGKFHALMAYLKMFLASVWLVWFSGLSYDVVVVDQISLPVLAFTKLSSKFKCLFYCHFPDQLLCIYDKKRNWLKRFYRAPIDYIEMKTTGMAHAILVNSQFTRNIFRKTFPSLNDKEIDVLYPSLNTELFDAYMNQFGSDLAETDEKANELQTENSKELNKLKSKKYLFLSINRYERKKDLRLAIEAMLNLRESLNASEWRSCHLVMAGGYDPRVSENVEHYKELRDLCTALQLDSNISFLRSISDRQKVGLLRQAFCLIYTPTNEHFGIVPIEAMYCEKPVIATNTGGPLETVAHDETGFLVEPNAGEFAMAMYELINDESKHRTMCSQARSRVINNFSFLSFEKKLNKILENLKSHSKTE